MVTDHEAATPVPAPPESISERLLPTSVTPVDEKPSLTDLSNAAVAALHSAPVAALVSLSVTYAGNYADAHASVATEWAFLWAAVATLCHFGLAVWNQYQTGPRRDA